MILSPRCTTLASFSLLALTTAASAQKSFDLIVPDAVEVAAVNPGTFIANNVGILVNTGTEPITRSDFDDASVHSRSAVSLLLNEVRPGLPNFTVLNPGEAAGVNLPLYTQLLEPHETLVSNNSSGLFLRLNDVEGTTTQLTTHMEIGDHRARLSTQVTITAPGTPFAARGATRIASVQVTPGVEQFAGGCELPGMGAFTLAATGASDPYGGHVSRYSVLPVLGNDRFGLFTPHNFPIDEIGRPWAIVIGLPDQTVSFLGCDLIPSFATVATGTMIGSPRRGRVFGPNASLPIPNQAALAGVGVGVQSYVLTPNAANGLGAASAPLRLNLFGTSDV